MPEFTFFITIKDIFFAVFMGLFILLLLVGFLYSVLQKFLTWRREGYCRHEWDLQNTSSFGTVHRYKCNKCNVTKHLDSNYVRRTRK